MQQEDGNNRSSAKRITIRREHPRRCFFQKALIDWQNSVDEKYLQKSLHRAMVNVKNYPLEIENMHQLRQIQGIGVTIAARLDQAWHRFIADVGVDLPDKNDIRALKVGQCRLWLGLEGKGNAVVGELLENEGKLVKKKRKMEKVVNEEEGEKGRDGDGEVRLIVDNRENNGSRRKGKSVVDCLSKSDCRFDLRPLAIGDYLWVRRNGDGDERVMDYVVERKTWDDLSRSIRQGRFVEQKKRLRASRFKAVIVLAEGAAVPLDEQRVMQAMANSQIHDGFIVHHVADSTSSARFLVNITQRMNSASSSSNDEPRLFDDVQRDSKKTGQLSVQSLWARQLTVCPGMSAQRARLVADQFPSFSALSAFYTACPIDLRPGLLRLSLPEIPSSVSIQMAVLFGR